MQWRHFAVCQLHAQMERDNGLALCVFRIGDKGCFVEPTVFVDVKDQMAIARDEVRFHSLLFF